MNEPRKQQPSRLNRAQPKPKNRKRSPAEQFYKERAPQDERLCDPLVAAEYAEELAAGQHDNID